jgi:hypothetical protein
MIPSEVVVGKKIFQDGADGFQGFGSNDEIFVVESLDQRYERGSDRLLCQGLGCLSSGFGFEGFQRLEKEGKTGKVFSLEESGGGSDPDFFPNLFSLEKAL